MIAQWFFAGIVGAISASASSPASDLSAHTRPRFEDFRPDLGRFAHAVEERCGFAYGAALKLPNQHQLMIKLADPKTTTYAQFICLMDALPTKELKQSGVQVLLVGQSLR